MTVDVSIPELRRVVNLILDHIEHDLGVRQIALDQDDYWHVMSPEKYDLLTNSRNLGIGKLSDDWEFLAKLPDDRQQAVALMLIHVAPLLERIGEQVGG
jgi:hypothetical protein